MWVPPPLGAISPGNIVEGQYQYKQDLLALEVTAIGHGPQCFAPATPLSSMIWQKALNQTDTLWTTSSQASEVAST